MMFETKKLMEPNLRNAWIEDWQSFWCIPNRWPSL